MRQGRSHLHGLANQVVQVKEEFCSNPEAESQNLVDSKECPFFSHKDEKFQVVPGKIVLRPKSTSSQGGVPWAKRWAREPRLSGRTMRLNPWVSEP
jgi:hypothetical protein